MQIQRGIVSFPDDFSLSETRRGKDWEISSRAVTSGRQMVDTRGVVPDEESRSPFLYYHLRAGGQSVSKPVSIPSVFHSARDCSTQNGNYYCQAPPPVCLPSVYLTYLHTVSIKYWRWERPGNEATIL